MTLPPSLAGVVRPLAPPLVSVAATLTLALTSAAVHAENWVDVQPSAASAGWLQWDRDSLTPLDADRIAAVWRVGTARGRNHSVEQGRVDCRAASLQIGTSSYVDTGTGAAGYGGALVDYAAGTRVWQGRSTRLSDAERAAGFEFPSPGSASGRLIEAVCATRSASGPDRLATVATLDLRLDQATRACGSSSAQAARLRTGWLTEANGCARPSAPDCGSSSPPATPPALTPLAGLGLDLARAAAGLTCTYLPDALAQAADDDLQRAATARFQACVARAIPQLDDRVSEADVIASGVFGACRGELPASVAQGPRFANGLLPGLTAAVLKHRSAGRVSLPTKPKRSQAE